MLPTPLNVWREEGSQNQTETRGKVGERDHEAQASLLVSRFKKRRGGRNAADEQKLLRT